ncbi:hypothetical protein IMG5_010420, partial [Ichthyophthirius multifiliis]
SNLDDLTIMQAINYQPPNFVDKQEQCQQVQIAYDRVKFWQHFLKHDPEGNLQNQIKALGEAKELLLMVKELIQNKQDQNVVSLIQMKDASLKPNGLIPSNLQNKMVEINISQSNNDQEKTLRKIEEAIILIDELKSEYNQMYNDSQNFPTYAELLKIKNEQLKNNLEQCEK